MVQAQVQPDGNYGDVLLQQLSLYLYTAEDRVANDLFCSHLVEVAYHASHVCSPSKSKLKSTTFAPSRSNCSAMMCFLLDLQ